MNSRQAWRLLLSQGRGDRWVSRPRGHFSPALRRGNNSTTANGSFGFYQERHGHPREK
ncbi:CCDC90B isoform 11 [Pongo abelii]|uniref:CCDC90B isoform 11 n=1 Tax=Pongo abelii TaxID=9601 RepID=A0A2J8V0F1_PONAB|nr:CCDC90B isoform 3 [Pongo abelii]PNJ51001.1 CCDC90B isoform 11 [Pongo abelii]